MSLEDVVALCQTNQELINGVFESTVLKLVLEKCPYFKLKYSQSENWVGAASHLLNDQPSKFENNVSFPNHQDTPLPDDFHALCKDVKKTSA